MSKKKKYTFEQCEKSCKDMWKELSEATNIRMMKSDTNVAKVNYFRVDNCPACEYVFDRNGGILDCKDNRSICPIRWGVDELGGGWIQGFQLPCCAPDAEYQKWYGSTTLEEKQYWAKKISEKKWYKA